MIFFYLASAPIPAIIGSLAACLSIAIVIILVLVRTFSVDYYAAEIFLLERVKNCQGVAKEMADSE